MSKIAMMRCLKHTAIALVTACLFTACDNNPKESKITDTPATGELNIAADETYKPVIEEEVKVFLSTYPGAKITVAYKPEAEVIKDYLEGKTKLILVARPLTAAEESYCEEKKIVPSSLAIAKDAVAVIVHPSAPDTSLSMAQLKSIIDGTYKKKYSVVFDRQGSSTLRFIKDSLMTSKQPGKNLFAANGNAEVVQYVAGNPDALGFVGLSYVSDTIDSTAESFSTNVKLVRLMNDSTGEFYQPYQAYIALKLYPLSRKLLYIKNETYPGLATGFSNFLASEKGQLIFAHARLFPLRMNITIRDAAVNR